MQHHPVETLTNEARADAFFRTGWCTFPQDERLARWIDDARPHALAAVDASEFAEWFRYGNTWFVGVNALGNDTAGRVGANGRPLSCAATDFVAEMLGLQVGRDFQWDAAQVSVCYPGYPQPMEGETDGAFRYRVKRDAAHVDGLHAVGAGRRRHLVEPHAFILGIPLSQADPAASPLVVWEGSHDLVRDALRGCYDGVSSGNWKDVDITDAYQAVRKTIFETCTRTVVQANPGECYLVHRLALHGVAPWGEGARIGAEGRMILYFRPEFASNGEPEFRPWLEAR